MIFHCYYLSLFILSCLITYNPLYDIYIQWYIQYNIANGLRSKITS